MKNKPLISVIMNCFNGERYLKESIESIISQTYENWELIFWDNQSTDKAKKFLKVIMIKGLNFFLQQIIQCFMKLGIKQYKNVMVSL